MRVPTSKLFEEKVLEETDYKGDLTEERQDEKFKIIEKFKENVQDLISSEIQDQISEKFDESTRKPYWVKDDDGRIEEICQFLTSQLLIDDDTTWTPDDFKKRILEESSICQGTTISIIRSSKTTIFFIALACVEHQMRHTRARVGLLRDPYR